MVNPLIEISTKQIFENLNLNKNYKDKFDYNDIDKAKIFNYLEEKKMIYNPLLKRFAQKLKRLVIF